jgi:hypothetical protein
VQTYEDCVKFYEQVSGIIRSRSKSGRISAPPLPQALHANRAGLILFSRRNDAVCPIKSPQPREFEDDPVR